MTKKATRRSFIKKTSGTLAAATLATPFINFSAKKGIYNTKLGQLKLLDDVHLWSSKGTNFFTDNISYDIDSGVFIGDRIILVNGPWGSLEGKGFIFKTKISTIKVKGRPLLNLKTEND